MRHTFTRQKKKNKNTAYILNEMPFQSTNRCCMGGCNESREDYFQHRSVEDNFKGLQKCVHVCVCMWYKKGFDERF